MLKKLTYVFAGLTLFAANVGATVTTYTDRAAFQAAAGAYVIDQLNDVSDGSGGFGLDRGPYAFTMSSFGCNSGPGQCGDNQTDGMFYPAYIWTYNNGSFNFDNAIHSFGLDYGSFFNSSAAVTLNGYSASTTNGGFFGIIDSDAFTSISYNAADGNLFDNVTYSATQTSQIPEPGSLVLVGLGLIGLVAARRRNFLS